MGRCHLHLRKEKGRKRELGYANMYCFYDMSGVFDRNILEN